MIRGHGDDLYRYDNIEVNCSSNVYAATEHEELIRHLQELLPALSVSYPEPEPYRLQSLIAKHHGLSEDNVLVTNGATEAIYLIAHLFRGKQVKIAEPTFSEYRSASDLYASPIGDTGVVHWLCNPNNPTGQISCEDKPNGVTLVVDRSYEYFSRISLPQPIIDEEHIYVYSLTKRYAIPGLRLGYIISSASLVAQLKALRQPWSVNALAIAAGEWIAEKGFPEMLSREALWQECDRLSDALSSIPRVKVLETCTHFLLITTDIKAYKLKDILASKYRILVRDASNFVGLGPYHIRIATQTPEMNDRLISAMTDIMSMNSYR